MSYVQGTVVRVSASISDELTGIAQDPSTLVLTIEKPDKTTSTLTLAGGGITRTALGQYFALIDTAPAWGTWSYQFATSGVNAVVARADITVRPALPI